MKIFNELKMYIEIYKNGKQVNSIVVNNQIDILYKMTNLYKKKANKRSNSKIVDNFKTDFKTGVVNTLEIVETQKQYNFALNCVTVESVDIWTYKYIIMVENGQNRNILEELKYNE